MSSTDLFDELEFTRISARTNIYSTASVVTVNKNSPLIFVCSFNGKLTCLTATKQANWKILETKLPGLLDHQEVISFDLFQTHSKEDISSNQTEKKYFIVFGVTLCQTVHTAEKEPIESYSFSIYETPWDADKPELSLSRLGLKQSMPISFVPYKLAHVYGFLNGKDRVCFLLCGGDKKIRMFYKSESTGRILEVQVDSFSPMLSNINSVVIAIQIENFNDNRYIVAGSTDGILKIGIAPILPTRRINLQKEIHFSINLFSPISSLHMYPMWTMEALNQSKPIFFHRDEINEKENVNPEKQENSNTTNTESTKANEGKENTMNLVVTCGIGVAYVFKSIETLSHDKNSNINSLIKRKIKLPESDKYNTLLCCTSMDVDFDGRNEILIGTYSQELLVYKEKINVDLNNPEEINKPENFQVIWQRGFAYPLYGIYIGDFNMDGLIELVVITMFGIHILQYNLEKAKERCLYTLKLIDEIKIMKEVLEQKLVIPKHKSKLIRSTSSNPNKEKSPIEDESLLK